MENTSTSLPLVNRPHLAGCLASEKERFGAFGRYAVAAVHTRFDAVTFFVWDAEVIERLNFDGTSCAAIIRQAATKAEAVAGLAGEVKGAQ